MSEEHPKGPEEKTDLAIRITTSNRFIRSKKVVPERSTEEEEVIPMEPFVGAYARVRRTGKLTINLGDYENAVVEVSVDIPCYLPDLDLADEYADHWIAQRMKKANEDGKRAREAKKKARQG